MIEIILQVAQHVKNARILVATQSNHAANVVSGRLISNNPNIAPMLLRLVSNAVLDKKGLPKHLHKVSGSVLNTVITDDDLFEHDETTVSMEFFLSMSCAVKFIWC